MAKNKVIWQRIELESEDGVISFPQKRTLYVDQFTDDETSITSEICPFHPLCMKDVFDFYKPRVIIDLEDEKGTIIEEAEFVFTDIKDFDDDHLVAQIKELIGGQDSPAKSKSNKQNWDCIAHNLVLVRDSVKKLEISYRTLSSFFDNTGQPKVDFLTLMSVCKDDLSDSSSEAFISVQNELEENYDKLDLRDSYSLLVIPGYLGGKDAVCNWAKVAFRNQVMLITDFKDCENFNMLCEFLERADLQGPSTFLTNVVMTCNYCLGRKKSEKTGEEEDLYIPGSAALAGLMSNIDNVPISQGVAGRKYGVLNNVKDVRFKLEKPEIAKLIDFGMIPIFELNGDTMAFSNRSLYNGEIEALTKYPNIRVLDWIEKVIIHFCNTQAFFMWDSAVEDNMKKIIHDFLIEYKGELYVNYFLNSINMDHTTKELSVSLDITPFYAARNFLIEIKGKPDKNHSFIEWEHNVSQ